LRRHGDQRGYIVEGKADFHILAVKIIQLRGAGYGVEAEKLIKYRAQHFLLATGAIKIAGGVASADIPQSSFAIHVDHPRFHGTVAIPVGLGQVAFVCEARGRVYIDSPKIIHNIHKTIKVVNAIFQELRQPLASIVGYTDLLLSETGGILGALQQSFLERIKASLERINAVLENLSGKNEPGTKWVTEVNLNDVIDGSISSAGEQLRDKRVTLRLDVPDQLPEILADQDTLEQIIKNLLNNAIMASPFEGSIALRVTPKKQESLPYLLIEVEDSGGGIDPGDMQRVFSRRYRGDNPVIKGVGDNGIGLTIAKTLTEALDGRIWVQSEQGLGTTFSVLLPIIPKEVLTADSQG